MSLTVYLQNKDMTQESCQCPRCDHEHYHKFYETLYEENITHNLGRMADAVGIYMCMWRPEEIDIKQASDLIPILEQGLSKLLSNPEEYKKYDASNGWGTYEHFVPFVEKYLSACKENPDATVHVCR